jgi:hypothetical protein
MTERPILFSAPMVRALLDGSKTQTRRVVKDLPPWQITEIVPDAGGTGKWLPNGPAPSGRGMASGHWRPCPYGQPGDLLWVRETFYAFGRWETRFSERKGRDEWHFVDITTECDRLYQFDTRHMTPEGNRGAAPGWHKRPSIHMPRAASRILLEIVSVRVQRLGAIGEADARSEGVTIEERHKIGYCAGELLPPSIRAFRDLWESISGAGTWDANPWVWVVEFKRVTP